jgi:outer membrane lipoprotein-sorting protein
MKKLIIAAFLLILIPMEVFSLDGNQILRKIDRNLQPISYSAYRKLINVEPDGSKKEFVLFTAKKGEDKVISLFLAPASEKGRSTLRLGENMWLYIPNVGKPIRITSLQTVVGGVFNNSDIMRLDFSQEYDAVKIEAKEKNYLLTLKAKTNTVAYDRLEMVVDQAALVPIQIGCYSATGMLIKTLYYKEIKDFGNGIKRPAVIETDSPLHKGYQSIMIFSKLVPREFSDEAFTLNYLSKVDELR